MPWSTALRTRCISGSLIASMIERSSSVSSPSVSTRTCLPSDDTEVADDAREPRPRRVDRLQAGAHDAVLQVRRDRVQVLRGGEQSGIDVDTCGELQRCGSGRARARRRASSGCRGRGCRRGCSSRRPTRARRVRRGGAVSPVMSGALGRAPCGERWGSRGRAWAPKGRRMRGASRAWRPGGGSPRRRRSPVALDVAEHLPQARRRW